MVEMDESLVRLAKAHFKEWDGWDSVTLAPRGILNDEAGEEAFIVLVDGGALPSLGGVPTLTEAEWRSLSEKVQPGGFLVMGALESSETGPDLEASGALKDLMLSVGKWFDGMSLFRRAPENDENRLLKDWLSGPEFLLILSKHGAPPLYPAYSGFLLVEEEGA
jgi:hypothetical protein